MGGVARTASHMDAPRRDLVLLFILFTLVAVIRVTAPSDLATGDQPYQAAYIRDITERGAWIVQHLDDGTPASKPPLYNWLAAAPILALGVTNDFLLKLPSLLAGLAALFLTWSIARDVSTERAALFAGVLLVCSTMFSKQIYFARTDMLLALFVIAQIWAAIRLRPVVFWIAAALAMLTKGPIGVVIPLVALVVWWWRDGVLRERLRSMRVAWGLLLSLVPLGIWFAAAVSVGGDEVWQQLVVRETVDRFAAGSKSMEHKHPLYYVPHFLSRMAPASLLAVPALIALRRSRAERLPIVAVAWWFIAPFVLLSLVPSKRVDRLFPIFPAVCILAAWALDRWLSGQPVRGFSAVVRAIGILLIAAGLVVAIGVPARLIAIDNAPRAVLSASGVLLAVSGALMLLAAFRRNAGRLIVSLAAAMIIVIAIYQHALSVPAQSQRNGGPGEQAVLDEPSRNAHALPFRPHDRSAARRH